MKKFIVSIVNFFTEVKYRLFVKKKSSSLTSNKPIEKYRLQHILNGETTNEFYSKSVFKVIT